MNANVLYVVKRYPRLTETFILNEIRAMERLGTKLTIVSLLPPEPPPHHPAAADVKAHVLCLPAGFLAKVSAVLGAHGVAFRADPLGYARAVGQAWMWAALSLAPVATARQFTRAGFVAAVCRREKIAHIHAHFANTPTSVAHFASAMTGLSFSFTAHAKDLYLTPPGLLGRKAKAARFVATCTAYNADYLRRLLGAHAEEKVHLVYHGIDLPLLRFRNEMSGRAGNGRKTILSVGRLVAKKGHDDLIAACALLKEAGYEFRCRIVGEGPLRGELAAEISRLGLEGWVSLEGAMTHGRLIGLYEEADLFALAPRIAENGDRDGIPNVIAEAMAIGVPVVSTNVSGVPEIVRDGETGLLVPPRDPKALAAALARLICEPERAAELARGARALLERDFDLWSTTRALVRLVGAADDPVRVAPAVRGGRMCVAELVK